MVPDPRAALHVASAACDGIFLLTLPLGFWQLRHCRSKSSLGFQGVLKAVFGILLATILLLYWPGAFTPYIPYRVYYLISLSASIPATLGLSALLFQQQRVVLHKVSDQAKLYLLCVVIFDAVYLVMPTKSPRDSYTTHPVAIRFIGHVVLLFLELRTGHSNSGAGNKSSPDDTGSVLGTVFFTWINPLLIQGYRNVIVDRDLTPLGQDMQPSSTRKALVEKWSQSAQKASRLALPWALLKCLKGSFFAAVLPRLFLIVFRYSQPTLIKESIRFATADPSAVDNSRGFWLIISAGSIYVGLALSTAMYQHKIKKLKLMTRSAVIGLIHEKIMYSPSISYDDGQATTLMSTDAESLDGIGEMIHETWAQLVEVTIGMLLLAREVGWIWPLPLFLIFVCSHMSRFVAKHLQPRQKAWNTATQNRIAATSSMLSEMKVVKMLGLQDKVVRRIEELRNSELWEASKLRWIMVYNNASANALGIFSPALTLVTFAIISSSKGRLLDTETAFTTVAILSMITHPANMIMTIVPRAVSAFAGVGRIQSFLLQPSLQTYRATLPSIHSKEFSSHHSNSAIQISELSISNDPPVLENISIDVASGTFTVISGPTGSGKSTLLRAILGEVAPTRGSISLTTQRIAYCAQGPWLPSGTIREVIYGGTPYQRDFDEAWYHEVTEICCLAHDFDSLPDGDQTQVGSRGLNLSGGQRQRVTLARALFSRCDIILLDDVFSGLDGETEDNIFNNLFGSTGLIRRRDVTVVLVSNNSQYFELADHVVVLGQGRIVDQGKWADIRIKATTISKFITSHSSNQENTVVAHLNDQVWAKEDTEADLSRQTGDSALYAYYFNSSGTNNLFYLLTATALYAFFITFPQYWIKLWSDSDGSSDWFYIGGYVFLSFMSWAATSTQMWAVVIRLAPQSGAWLHQRLLHTITSAPLSYFSQTENGSILNRFSQDIQVVDKSLPSALQTVVTQIFKLFMQAILLCFAQKWLVLSLPLCMVVLWVVQKIYLRTSKQLRFLELQSRAGIFTSFLDSIEGLETIRSFTWTRQTILSNIHRVETAQKPEYLLLSLQRWLNLVLDLLAAAIATSVVALAVMFRDSVDGGQVGIALNIMLVANTTLLKLVESYTTLENSIGAVSRLRGLEILTPEEGGDEGEGDIPEDWPSRGEIKIDNVTAGYHMDNTVLQGLNLDIKAGQKVIICGRTGSGKSTILSVLLRLIDPKSGTITLDDIDITRLPPNILREKCFVTISQDPLILPNETLRFNLSPSPQTSTSPDDEIFMDAISKVGLSSQFPHHNNILDQPPPATLSTGQKQLFALCRGLVKAKTLQNGRIKPVVLLDEITSSLDTETERLVQRIIEEEFTDKGLTVLMVAHRFAGGGGGGGKLGNNNGKDDDVVVVRMSDGRVERVIRGDDALDY
ncbi:putative ABC transporter [Poronia punctata]|nr:putative ABC transporter [Poronia punctata]